MGRPLNKKYFGNRNIGRNGYEGIDHQNGYDGDGLTEEGHEVSNDKPLGDDGIGGSGIGSFTSIVAGSGWTSDPAAYVNAPSLPGGIHAEIIPHYKALSFDTTANGTGYAVGDVLQVVSGTQTTRARAPITAILSVDTPNITNGGSLYDVTSPTVGDKVTFTHANLSVGLRVRITSVSGSTATGIVVEQAGVWTGTSFPTSMAHNTNGFTATTTARPGGDDNGFGLVLGFTANMWGAYSFGAPTVPGDYTVFPDTGVDGLLTSVTGSGTGAKADITMGLLSVDVPEKGSGYTSTTDDALLRFEGSANGASAVTVFAADTGAVGSATNQENAIIAYVYQDSERRIADIVKQTGTKRFVFITNADGAGSGKEDEAVQGYLVPHESEAADEADITATDANGNEYWVTKITAHKATLTRKNENGGTTTYTGTGYIDNNSSGGTGAGETLHIVSINADPGAIGDGTVVTWTQTPAQGSAYTTTISGGSMGSGEYGYVTYYVPNAQVYLGDHTSPVAMEFTVSGGPDTHEFETGQAIPWNFGPAASGYVVLENA
jgi:hypothetical protein